jgi:hypothetical protein
MSTPEVLKICAGLYLAAVVVDLIRSRSYKRFLLELLPLIGLLVLDAFITNAITGYLAFGSGTSPTVGVLIMFSAILLGVAARYIFYLKGEFSWLDFAKPLCISPILLLPLVGSIQAVKDLEAIQLVSFALLAFQNGFFWQAVLARSAKDVVKAPPSTKKPASA